MRSAPQRGLRPAISRMSAARVVGGRPDRRERRRQNARNPARCQRRMVAGWMSRVGSRQAGATRAARTIVKRCQGVYRTRPASFRLATMSCCRRSAFSATSSTRGERDPRPVRKRIEEGRSRVESYTVGAVGICSQDGAYDFGWSWGAYNGRWLAAAALLTAAFGLQLERPDLWPAWFAVAVLGVNCFVGGLLLRTTQRADVASLPLVELLRSDQDLVLDAGCGGGRTTLALSKVL